MSLEGTVPWPDDLAAAYRQAGWWRGQALGAEIADVAGTRPDAIALVDGPTRISYGSLLARADALATRLTDDLGLERGDRIVVQLPNAWPFAVLTLGCLRAGIIPVMALPAHREHELGLPVPAQRGPRPGRPRHPARLRPPGPGGAGSGPPRKRWSTSWSPRPT